MPVPTIALTRSGDLSRRSRLGSARCSGALHGARLSFVPAVRVGDLEIDVMEDRVRCGATVPERASTEQAIPFVLAPNAGHTVTRETIRRTVWGGRRRAAEQHRRAPRALAPIEAGDSWRSPRYIATMREAGCRLVAA